MKQIFIFFIVGSMLFICSCSKPGTGGKATLVVFIQHHGRTIINHEGYPDTVFIKFNVKELPGLHGSDYDAYFVGAPGEDHVNCTGLKAGQYFLFGVGMDSLGSCRVVGGMTYKIKHKERKSETVVDLAVTE